MSRCAGSASYSALKFICPLFHTLKLTSQQLKYCLKNLHLFG